MNNLNPNIASIIGSENIPPPHKSSPSSLHLESEAPGSHTPTTSRKRARDCDYKIDNDSGSMTIDKQIVSDHMNDSKRNDIRNDKDNAIVVGLRLEAIFHPKFDNERERKRSGNNAKVGGKKNDGSRDIRSMMLQKLGLSSGLMKNDNIMGHTSGNTSLQETDEGTGHLEVSLKHSGSLVLWSGSTRYYSKNSACNEFTRTAEILLRQWFETVRKALVGSTKTQAPDSCSHSSFRSYDDCSMFVSHHRFTIAFEVVTAEMLGDHGQIPHHDYVVVTAVADRRNERFLSTTEVLEFCHRYRLPHNDVWTFFPPTAEAVTSSDATGAMASAEALFQLYDNSLRETGYTDDAVRGLTDIADVYIPSPVPHSIFQGSICEGFIVRYVDDADIGPAKERKQLEGLSQVARDILKEVTPPSPPAPKSPSSPPLMLSKVGNMGSDNLQGDSVFVADLRTLYRSIPCGCLDNHEKGQKNLKASSAAVTLQRRRVDRFSESLKNILQDVNKNEDDANFEGNGDNEMRRMKRARRRQQRNDLTRIEKKEGNNQVKGESIVRANSTPHSTESFSNYPFLTDHLPTLTKNLLESRDRETKRIARLLQTLDRLKAGAVTYTWMEKFENENGNNIDSVKNTTGQQRNRLYVIIHVHNDSTFFKFQSAQDPSDMPLFRGFCVELMLSSLEKQKGNEVDWGEERRQELTDTWGSALGEHKPRSNSTTLSTTNGNSGTPLMLKMKLLPYMVRTFICRNLLKIIFEKGPEEFERIALGLLEKWNISSDTQERWLSFFRGWALYVMQYKTEQEIKLRLQHGLQQPDTISYNNGATKLFPPTGNTLLELEPLTNFSYLRHLEHFAKLYEKGEFRTVELSTAELSPEFRTFVCVCSQSTEVSSALSNYFADHFNGIGSKKNENKSIAEARLVVCSIGEAAKNRRSKSCIAYANIADLTKGIKKFISDKRVAKQSILILVGSSQEKITPIAGSTEYRPSGGIKSSWLDISSEGEGKKLKNMWKSWKKFPCAKRIELNRSAIELEPKREDSITAVINSVKNIQSIIDGIRGVGRSLIEKETKKKDPNPGGILAFFPGIPGCGKSSLLQSLDSKLEEEIRSHNEKTGNVYDGTIHIKEGDKIGKKFWIIIEDLLSDDGDVNGKSPALVIADKNAPPASWPKLGQICHESRAMMLPVLPDSSVLKTTTIEGSILPTGEFLPHVSHFYPFSLEYLAVSLCRVLSRPPGEHTGKLDCGFPLACMVVIQFFSFYRYIGADTYQEKMNEKFDKDGVLSIQILKVIKLPFLTKFAQNKALPNDLTKLLVEALQLRHGHDKDKKFKVKKDDAQMIEMERRLRSSIERHKKIIGTMTVTLEDTTEAFVAQIMEQMKSLINTKTKSTIEPTPVDSTSGDDVSTNIKLVSLDIDRIEIHNVLRKYHESGALKNFFESIGSLSKLPHMPKPKTEDSDSTIIDANKTMSNLHEGETKENTTELYPVPDFIERTHVTMAFAGEISSAETLLSNYRHLQGREVTVSVTSFLWSSTNAALAIKISPCAVGENPAPVPPCENSFAHVTVWCAPNVKAFLSNQLPNLVKSGNASRVNFNGEDELVGRITFWNHKNEPFEV